MTKQYREAYTVLRGAARIRLPTRARIGFVMAWVALYVVALASMAVVAVLR